MSTRLTMTDMMKGNNFILAKAAITIWIAITNNCFFYKYHNDSSVIIVISMVFTSISNGSWTLLRVKIN